MKRGERHDYLGSDTSYEKKGEIRISMKQYIEKIIESFPAEIGSSSAATPAANHLFQIRDKKEAKLLPKEQAKQLHHTVAQLLLVCLKARRDIQTAISFLNTRVKAPGEDDWVELK